VAAGTVEPLAKATSPIVEPAAGPVVDAAAPVTEPILKEAAPINGVIEPVLKETAPVVKPIVNATESMLGATEPVLNATETVREPLAKLSGGAVEPLAEATTPIVGPVVDATVPAVESVLDAAEPVVGRVLEEATPVVGPILSETGSIDAPVGGVLGPVADEPILGSAPPAIEASPGTPLGETVPAAPEPTLAPIVGEEGSTPLLLGSAAPPEGALLPAAAEPTMGLALEPITGNTVVDTSSAVPAFSVIGSEKALSEAAVSSHSATRSAEESAASSETTSPGLSGSLPRLFDGSLFGELRAALLPPGTVANLVATGAQDRTPLLPFGFPDGVPVGGSTLGSSGFGIGLDLLAALALLSLLSRTGGSSRFPRDLFKLVSSPRLVTELPG
jgi:hypothetical protein